LLKYLLLDGSERLSGKIDLTLLRGDIGSIDAAMEWNTAPRMRRLVVEVGR